MERHEFDAHFRDFAERAQLETPLRLLLLAWVDSNWRRVREMDQSKIRKFLNLAHERIVSDQVAKQVITTCVKRGPKADPPLVTIQRINNHIQVAHSQVAGDNLGTFQRLMGTLRLEGSDGGSSPARR